MNRIVSSKDMILLGLSLSSNQQLAKDNPELVKEFYAHVYKHRFLLTNDDKKVMNEIFQSMNIMQLYTKFLDFFQEIKRKDIADLACKLWDIQIDPDQFRVDFDFQNSVVII